MSLECAIGTAVVFVVKWYVIWLSTCTCLMVVVEAGRWLWRRVASPRGAP